ncbi:MAG TPA: hypothetical protein H9881_03985 [Candidatus Stackebrandtia excrementipullorum]|nr:hypothetical protein [Candidatus Stackebrandtia excrementipullorum]
MSSGPFQGRWSRRNVLRSAAALGGLGALGVTAGTWAAHAQEATWNSDVVYPGADGRLVYETVENNSRIPDFSWAGYRNGDVPLPEVPTVAELGPVSGDNTERIQEALDAIGAREPDENGFRGALQLAPGEYRVGGMISINRSGVVLRGSSQAVDGTVLLATGPAEQFTVVRVGGSGTDEWSDAVPGTRTDITSEFVQVGSRTFTVADPSALSVGDNIVVYHPHTQAWTDAVEGGGAVNDPPWSPGQLPIVYNRYVKAIDGNEITICAPVFNHLDGSLTQSYVYAWDNAGIVRDCGVENLRITMVANSAEDENHPQNCIYLTQVEDAWVRDCTLLHFSFAGVTTRTATRCTVLDTRASHPRSKLQGSRRYNFNAGPRAQQVLFKGLRASHARHAFATSGTSLSSGCAWVDGFNDSGYSESGGHRQWSNGLLFDNIKELNNQSNRGHVISLHNRGDQGTAHGWSSVHSVAWNCTVDNGNHVVAQRPPTAQNYAIGTTGKANGNGWAPGAVGHIEGTNKAGLEPASLYAAQLADRLS